MLSNLRNMHLCCYLNVKLITDFSPLTVKIVFYFTSTPENMFNCQLLIFFSGCKTVVVLMKDTFLYYQSVFSVLLAIAVS